MPNNGTNTELYTRLQELCEAFRARGDIGCEVALDERHTYFAEEAFSGDWSEIVAEASPIDPAQIGQSGSEVLRSARQFFNPKTVRLVSPVRKPAPVPRFLQDLEAVAS